VACSYKRGNKISGYIKSENFLKIRTLWDAAPCSLIAMMIEAVRISETSVNSNETTRLYIPEGSNFHIRRRENLKSHTGEFLVTYCYGC
jgi:hypothetical protein